MRAPLLLEHKQNKRLAMRFSLEYVWPRFSGAQTMPAETQSDELEARVEDAIATCDGDPRAAIRALLVAISYLEAEVARLAQAVSLGYVRGQVRREPPD